MHLLTQRFSFFRKQGNYAAHYLENVEHLTETVRNDIQHHHAIMRELERLEL